MFYTICPLFLIGLEMWIMYTPMGSWSALNLILFPVCFEGQSPSNGESHSEQRVTLGLKSLFLGPPTQSWAVHSVMQCSLVNVANKLLVLCGILTTTKCKCSYRSWFQHTAIVNPVTLSMQLGTSSVIFLFPQIKGRSFWCICQSLYDSENIAYRWDVLQAWVLHVPNHLNLPKFQREFGWIKSTRQYSTRNLIIVSALI